MRVDSPGARLGKELATNLTENPVLAANSGRAGWSGVVAATPTLVTSSVYVMMLVFCMVVKMDDPLAGRPFLRMPTRDRDASLGLT